MAERLDRAAHIQAEWRRERPDLDVTPPGIIGRIHRIGIALTAEIVAVYAAHGLTQAEFEVLASLRRAGAPYERTPGDIANHTMVTGGATTKRIDKLEAEGLVERRIAETDKRSRVVALTDAGLRRIDEAFTAHIANEHRLIAALTAEQRATIEPILRDWAIALEDAAAPTDTASARPRVTQSKRHDAT